ncbi:hypothetical protein Hanom_Chr11g00991921 [Helianthus anomalus]
MSPLVVEVKCSGSKGNEESHEKVRGREGEEAIGTNLEPPHAVSNPMHEVIDFGGGNVFEEGEMHVSMGRHQVKTQEVGA